MLLAVSALLASCGTGLTGRRAPGRYGFDSVSAACQRTPALCAPASEAAPKVISSTTLQTLGSAVASLDAALRMVDEAVGVEPRRALEQCVNEARSTVLARRNFTRPPTPEECLGFLVDAQGQVVRDFQGRPITLARQLGREMHDVALACAKQKLSELRPGRFSLEPRYRHDPATGKTTFISPEEEAALLRAGGEQLRGTLKPDVVLHTGNPIDAQVVYDFKFPCVATDNPRWHRNEEGVTQGELYAEALRARVFRIFPWIGTIL